MSRPLKILYLTLVDTSARSGSNEHVIGIAGGFATLGHDVTLVAPASADPDARLASVGVKHARLRGDGPVIERALALRTAARALLAKESFDVVYLRAFPADWPLLLSVVPRAIPVAYELNTIIESEYVSLGKPRRASIYRWCAARALRRASGWLPVTHEIGRWAATTSGVERASHLALNGITPLPVSALEGRERTRRDHGVSAQEVVLAMAGFAYPWHGIDLVLEALATLPKHFRLWLIGSPSDAAAVNARALATRHGVAERLTVFGWRSHDEVSSLLSGCDIGLGALALERKRLREAQEMKIAHALAVGVPVVINHPDPRLPTGLPFVRQVASSDALALAAGILDLSSQLGPAIRSAAHEFASTRLSWRTAASDTAEFLQGLLELAPRG